MFYFKPVHSSSIQEFAPFWPKIAKHDVTKTPFSFFIGGFSEMLVVDVKLIPGRVLKHSCRYLPSFLSYRANTREEYPPCSVVRVNQMRWLPSHIFCCADDASGKPSLALGWECHLPLAGASTEGSASVNQPLTCVFSRMLCGPLTCVCLVGCCLVG